MKTNNMKKLALLLSVAFIALTACGPFEEPTVENITTKFVDKITNAVDGSVIALTYDSDMRVTGVTKTTPTDSSQDRHYEVKYNLACILPLYLPPRFASFRALC